MKRGLYFNLVCIAICTHLFWACNNPSKSDANMDMSNMDTTAQPANDFYRFVNGKWEDKTKIPDDQGRWGSFNELREKNNETVLAILTKAANNKAYGEGSDQRRAADFYAVGMDSLLAEKRGITPLKPWMQKIEGITNIPQLENTLIEMHTLGFSSFFGIGVFTDFKNSVVNSLYLAPDGLGLPNRDYYTKEDVKSVELREKYIKHIARMLKLAEGNKGDFSKEAQVVFDIENKLALASLTPVQERDLKLLYNKMGIDGLNEIAPSFNWSDYLSGQGINGVDSIIVTQPKYIAEAEIILTETPIEDIQLYLKWHLVNRAAPYLNNELVQANFDFFGKELNGIPTMKPRWKRVLATVNSTVGEALGKLYVDEAFPPAAKAEAKEMVNYIILAFGDRIDGLDWMSDETKKAAHHKLDNFTIKIGYPDKWKDYGSLVVDKDGGEYSYFSNILHASKFLHEENIAKIGKPVDKSEWGMNAQTVNAYYNPMNNELVFPAAILQPPFFYYGADPAVNFGGIGAVIGHEATHGFDDMGCNFDADGNMKNWWTTEDKERFDARTQKLVEQFDAYEPLEGVFVQGKLTLGENIADLGGLNLAYDGLQKYFLEHEKPADIEGYSQEQRFYMSWATIWRTKYKDEALRTQIMTDPHSPGMYRATGPLTNLEAFYEAFDVKEGNTHWLPDSMRIKIW